MSPNNVIERILELSVDAQMKRREAAEDSAAFHRLTGAITAYGKALALLTALQQREEFYATIGLANTLENSYASYCLTLTQLTAARHSENSN